MNLKKLSIEELEDMSHINMAYNILKFEKKQKTTPELFKEICNLLSLSEKRYQDLIGDFYTSLVVDKRFVLLDGKWDLKENTLIEESNDDIEEIDDIDIIEEIDEDEEIEEKDLDEDEEIIEEEPEEEEEDTIPFEEEEEEEEEE